MPKDSAPPAGEPVVINGDREPTPDNPHSWLVLLGDPPGTSGLRIMYGVLRPTYRNWTNSAASFARRKIAVVPCGADSWAVTAARAEVLLPADADDRFACPRVLMETIDAERPESKPVLLTYVTITFPTDRLHQQFELVRAFAMEELVRTLGVAVLAVQHAPNRAASTNTPHVHLLIGRRITSLGLADYAAPLCGDAGRKLIVERFAAFRAGWTS